MGKRKQYHFTPWEICEAMKEEAKERERALTVPYSGMAVCCNYSLWKDWHFSVSKLAKYNEEINRYYYEIGEGFFSYDDLQEKVLRVAPELLIQTEYKDVNKIRDKNPVLRRKRKEGYINNNIMNRDSSRYMVLFFTVLMDLGYTEKKLLKARDYVIDRIKIYTEHEDKHFLQLHSELLDGTGIYIEVPEMEE